jgi:hypothetical protein
MIVAPSADRPFQEYCSWATLTASNGGAPGRAEQVAGTAVSTEVRRSSWKRSVVRPVALAALVAVALTGALTASILSQMRHEQKRTAAAAEVATATPRVAVGERQLLAALWYERFAPWHPSCILVGPLANPPCAWSRASFEWQLKRSL